MRAIVKIMLAAAGAVALASLPAAAVTKPKAYHCINSKHQEVKGATTQAECKAPYKWAKVVSFQPVKKGATASAAGAAKHKKHVATTKTPSNTPAN